MYGSKLKEIIEKAGYTQKEVADKIGTSQQNLSAWLNKEYPPLEGIEKICHSFNITLPEFFSDIDTSAITLTEQEKKIIKLFKQLPKELKLIAIDSVFSLLSAYNLIQK